VKQACSTENLCKIIFSFLDEKAGRYLEGQRLFAPHTDRRAAS